LFGRDYEGLLGLEASALIMTLFQPRVLYDVGFQLSFLATLGLIIIARPLQEWCYVKDWLPILKEGLIITLAAELMILPLVAFYFHQVSFVSLTANLLAVPALEGIMATGLFALGMGWIFGWWLPVIAQITGYSVSIFLTYLIATVEFFANLPFASATLPAFHPIWIFYYYLLLGLILWLLRDPQKRGRTLLARASSSPLVWGGTASLAVLVWLAVFFL
jgi:competence protein ComEC